MTEGTALSYADFALPPSVVTKSDLSHLVSEFERVDNELTTAAVRAKAGASQPSQLSLSTALTDFMNLNRLRPNSSTERTEIIRQMRRLKDNVPTIHMTFAVEADAESLQNLASWVRTSIHPQAVIAVGLQPSLVAGVYLRTPNHVKDLSMRSLLKGGHDRLVQDLESLRGASQSV